MTENAKIFLAIIRDATAHHVWIPQELGPILRKHLGITEQDAMEVGEILKADMRERFCHSPYFAEINAELEKFPKLI